MHDAGSQLLLLAADHILIYNLKYSTSVTLLSDLLSPEPKRARRAADVARRAAVVVTIGLWLE